MRIVIYPYDMRSVSSKRLAKELRSRGHYVIRARRDGAYRPSSGDVIINWGNSRKAAWHAAAERERESTVYLNTPATVSSAINKVTCLSLLEQGGVSTVPFTASLDEAKEFTGKTFIRYKTSGKRGTGIVVINSEHVGSQPVAPLYTELVPNAKEYRVHVFTDTVVDVQEKRKRVNFTGLRSALIKNKRFGYVFCRKNIAIQESTLELAEDAVRVLGLDFGAVDILESRDGVAYVLEVNTAVGMEGTTLNTYATCIEAIL